MGLRLMGDEMVYFHRDFLLRPVYITHFPSVWCPERSILCPYCNDWTYFVWYLCNQINFFLYCFELWTSSRQFNVDKSSYFGSIEWASNFVNIWFIWVNFLVWLLHYILQSKGRIILSCHFYIKPDQEYMTIYLWFLVPAPKCRNLAPIQLTYGEVETPLIN